VQRVDVAVVGAGAMGSATAWRLARRGHDVVLLERFEQGHCHGSSHGGSRIFRFAYEDPDYARLAVEALPLWRELEDDSGRTLVEITGGVDHGRPEAVDRIVDSLAAVGAPAERLHPDAAAERFPGMRFDRAVVYSPDTGRCLADLAVRTLQERAGALGAQVRFSAGAAAVDVHDDHVVVRVPDDESWRARVAVITVGGWAEPVLGGSGKYGMPPLIVTEELISHFTPRDPNREWPSFIHHGDGLDAYGLRTPGEGVKVGGHHEGAVVQADDRTFALDPAHVARTVAYVERWLPGLDPTPHHGATCLYTNTPTEDFVLDRVGPLVIGSACSGHGFKFTPLVGRILADLAEGVPTPLPRFRLSDS
jgi:sarcosine oxidase